MTAIHWKDYGIVGGLCALLFYAVIGGGSIPNIPTSEMHALEDLYEALNGNDWLIYGNRWNFTGDHNPCYELWEGLSCTCLENNSTVVEPWSIYAGPGYVYYYDDSFGISGANCSIQKILLAFTNLSGTIPSSISSLTNLTNIHFEYNTIFGTIPSSLATLSLLERLELSWNQLSGPIPSELGLLTRIKSTFLYNNLLTGTIPTTFCNFVSVQGILLNNNSLFGQIPSCLGNLQELELFFLYDNYLTGPFPQEIYQISGIIFLDFSSNFLTGSLSSKIGSLTSLAYLTLNSNLMEGLIPNEVGDVTSLAYIQLNGNYFTGTLPESFGNLKALQNLWLYSNKLTGTMPCSMSKLTSLINLLVQDNIFEGNLGCFVNASSQHNLSVVDVSSNQFTGAIPVELFRLKSIFSVAAAKNCLSGSVPVEICSASQLQVLALDGLSTATSCQHRLPGVASYTVSALKGDIPACLFSIPKLHTLLLSGNGFLGPIPQDLVISDSLQNLFLGFNRLSGPIPLQIQNRLWQELSLPSNKLSGTLSNDINVSSSTSLNLAPNRLSGTIPGPLRYLRNIFILDGNMFTCAANRLTLPVYDSYNTLYTCGSEDFNLNLYIWLGFFSAFGMIIIAASSRRLTTRLKHSLNFHVQHSRACLSSFVDATKRHKSVDQLSQSFVRMVLFSVLLLLLQFVVFCPLYSALNSYYRNHEFVYAYVLSPAFLSGKTPATMMVIAWIALFLGLRAVQWMKISLDGRAAILRLLSLLQQQKEDMTNQMESPSNFEAGGAYARNSAAANDAAAAAAAARNAAENADGASLEQASNQPAHDTWRLKIENRSDVEASHLPDTLYNRCLRYCQPSCALVCLVLVNVTIVSAFNACYVYILLKGVRFQLELLLQVALAVFKLSWNSFALRYSFYLTEEYRKDRGDQIDQTMTENKTLSENRSDDVLLRITYQGLVVFNNIMIPCATVTCLSVNCFHYVFFEPPTVVSSYQFVYCNILYLSPSGTCRASISTTTTLSTSFQPPFVYNYQCAADILRAYSSVFVTTALLTTFILVPIRYFAPLMPKSSTELLRALGVLKEESVLEFQKVQFATRVITMSAVILTFGFIFPPVGIVMSLALIVEVMVTAINIGHFLRTTSSISEVVGSSVTSVPSNKRIRSLDAVEMHSTAEFVLGDHGIQLCNGDGIGSAGEGGGGGGFGCVGARKGGGIGSTSVGASFSGDAVAEDGVGIKARLHRGEEMLVAECELASEWLEQSLQVTIPTSALFYALFVMDILGDVVGAKSALWAPLVVVLFPCLLDALATRCPKNSWLNRCWRHRQSKDMLSETREVGLAMRLADERQDEGRIVGGSEDEGQSVATVDGRQEQVKAIAVSPSVQWSDSPFVDRVMEFAVDDYDYPFNEENAEAADSGIDLQQRGGVAASMRPASVKDFGVSPLLSAMLAEQQADVGEEKNDKDLQDASAAVNPILQTH